MCRLSTIIFILLFSCKAHAQFKGIDSFRWDSLWQRKLQQAGVKSVKEFFAGKTDYNTGRCMFDKKGRLVELSLAYDGGYRRISYTYSKSQLIKVVSYDPKDTTKVISREDRQLDKSGKTSYTITTDFIEGKWTRDSSETKIFNKSKTVTVKESTFKKAGKIYRTTEQKDSLDGTCTFLLNKNIEYFISPPRDWLSERRDSVLRPEIIETEAEVVGPENYISRTISWYCDPKKTRYSVEITSYTFEGKESIDKIKTNYLKYDDKNRLIELGEIYKSEFPPTPHKLSSAGLTNDLIKQIVDATPKGRELMKLQFIYKDDLLVEENIVGTKKEYVYNGQKQLIKTTEPGGKNEICIYNYNEKGLITGINCTSSYNGNSTGSKTTKYLYEYH